LQRKQADPDHFADLSLSVIKLIGPGEYVLERFGSESFEKGWISDGQIEKFDEVAEAVKRLVTKSGTKTRQVVMAMPQSAVITKKIMLPAGLREEELEVQVETEANQYIPFALDEVNLDFQILGAAPNNPEEVEVLIAASRKEKVDDRVAIADAAGLKPRVMDVESYATEEAFRMISPSLPANGRDQNIAQRHRPAMVEHPSGDQLLTVGGRPRALDLGARRFRKKVCRGIPCFALPLTYPAQNAPVNIETDTPPSNSRRQACGLIWSSVDAFPTSSCPISSSSGSTIHRATGRSARVTTASASSGRNMWTRTKMPWH
jgi:hypothetical protein